MAIDLPIVKIVTARTRWTIESMMCQNVLDLGDLTDEEEQQYYRRMIDIFGAFCDVFKACQKDAATLHQTTTLPCGCMEYHRHSERTGYCLDKGCLSCAGQGDEIQARKG